MAKKDEIRFSIELRADEARQGPGRIVGQLMRYGEQAQDRRELFEKDSLEWPSDGVILNRQHTRTAPILRFTPTIDGDVVTLDAAIPDTTAGRDAATEIRSGLLRGLSIEFRSLRERVSGGVRRIQKAVLTGAGLVDTPAYQSAVELRSKRRRVWL